VVSVATVAVVVVVVAVSPVFALVTILSIALFVVDIIAAAFGVGEKPCPSSGKAL
jgi:hypothetical protein